MHRARRLLLLAWIAFEGLSTGVALAQQSQPTRALVFDGVTVIDVEHGSRLSMQRVVVRGMRITAVGPVKEVAVPSGARVIHAKGKYVIPGLWDMHVHPFREVDTYYPLFIAHGITGIRDAGSPVPLDTQRLWRREVLTGTRVGPPRQILSGPVLDENEKAMACPPGQVGLHIQHLCIGNPTDARQIVDSLKAAGADIVKTYDLSLELYFAIASEARRVGLPFGGHLSDSAIAASDSGALFLDHLSSSGGVGARCFGNTASIALCQPIAEHFRKNNTWLVPTLAIYPAIYVGVLDQYALEDLGAGLEMSRLYGPASQTIIKRMFTFSHAFWNGATNYRDALSDSSYPPPKFHANPNGFVIARQVGLPMVAGTDVGTDVQKVMLPGFGLHVELTLLVAEGLTPLEALRMATLDPAKALHATDSLGTVAAGKLADFLVLDSDPLTDIRNTSHISAVVANGRYFQREQLDKLLASVQTKAEQK